MYISRMNFEYMHFADYKYKKVLFKKYVVILKIKY